MNELFLLFYMKQIIIGKNTCEIIKILENGMIGIVYISNAKYINLLKFYVKLYNPII